MLRTQKIPAPGEIGERIAPVFQGEGLRLVLLFGSAASGRGHSRSDIDLAFLFDKPINILALTNEVIGLLSTDNVDVIDLRRASPLLKFAAVKSGKLLYEKTPGIFNEFCSLAFRMYLDTEKLRIARTRSIRNFLKGRGVI